MAEITGPFKSVEEAYVFVKSHEIATNKKFAVGKSKGMNTQDVSSLETHKIQWEYSYGGDVNSGSEGYFDGIPFIACGSEVRVCVYGPRRKSRAKPPPQINVSAEEGEDVTEDTDNQRVITTTEKNQQLTDVKQKQRRNRSSKKLNCRARITIRKIIKFPEYAMEVDTENPKKWFRCKMAKQLKENFSEHTKRYILVFVHVMDTHNHEDTPIQILKKDKKIVHVVDKGCTRIPKVSIPVVLPKGVTLLKKWATLKGKNLMDLAMQFKTTADLPALLARPRASQKLEDMEDQELLSLYYEITGELPNNMFSIANKEFTTSSLRLLVHLCIVFANAASNASKHLQTHPSIRIKGTEANFTPVPCLEIDCPVIEPHMHCPLCAQTDSYTDTDLLKQHFTNKHVQKAIEFGGLKILRCYDLCEVLGRNMYCKTFEGGHWHCYKCSNGLNKRNSAMDHYQSHLKDCQSNLQIQVAQDWYPSTSGLTVSHEIEVSTYQWETYQAAAALNTMSTSPFKTVSRSPLKRSYTDAFQADMETIDQNAVYMEEEVPGYVNMPTYTAQQIPTTGNETYVISVPESGEFMQMKTRVQELEMKCQELEKETSVQKSLIEFLKKKDTDQCKIIELHKTEKQDLNAQIETLKKEVETLKSAETGSSVSAQSSLTSVAVSDRNRSPRNVKFQQLQEDLAASFHKANELKERLRNEKTGGKEESLRLISNNRPAVAHSFGTRRSSVKLFKVKSSNDSKQNPCNVILVKSPSSKEHLSKLKNTVQNETLNVTPKLVSGTPKTLTVSLTSVTSRGTSTETPETLSLTPVTSTETPKILSLTPVTSTETQKTLSLTPVTSTETPKTLSLTPVTSTETPKTLSLTPVTSTETPKTLSLTPVTSTETPKILTLTSKETPKTLTLTSKETPKTWTLTPVTSTDTPKTLTLTSKETPKTWTLTPVTSAMIQKDREVSSEASDSQPTTMQEMCHQLLYMRKEIDLLKQATLAANSSPTNSSS